MIIIIPATEQDQGVESPDEVPEHLKAVVQRGKLHAPGSPDEQAFSGRLVQRCGGGVRIIRKRIGGD